MESGEKPPKKSGWPTVALILVAGLAIYLPTLGDGFYVDDFYHLALMEDMPRLPAPGALSLYTFADGNSRRMDPVQGDFLPWWAAPDLKLDFFRPLSCLVHHLDHRLYGTNPVGYHATNLVLWGLLLLSVVGFFRELSGMADLGPKVVLLAGLFFAVDEAHVLDVFWIAQRHALLGALLSVLAVGQYLRFRRRGTRGAGIASVLLLAAGLFSSEVALAMPCWVVAFELCLGEGTRSRCFLSALPIGLVTLGYLVFYSLLGHGAACSGWYLNPLLQPAQFFAKALAERIPMLAMGALTSVPADLSLLSFSRGAVWPVLLAWGLVALVVALLLPHLCRNRVSLFMALGALLSMLPSLSTWPMNRMLLLPTVGTAWVFAAFVLEAPARRQGRSGVRGFLPVIVGGLFLAVHGVVAPVQTLVFQRQYAEGGRRMWKTAVEAELPSAAEAGKARVLILNGEAQSLYLPVMLFAAGHPWPAALWPISVSPGQHRFTRTAPNAFLLEVGPPGLLSGVWERLVRPGDPVVEGQLFQRGALRIRIARVEGDQVRAIEVAIDRSLDDPEVWLLSFNGERWIRFHPPPQGTAVDLLETRGL